MGLKIKMVSIHGEQRVPPEVMDLLLRLAQHRQFCPQCERMMKGPPHDSNYCGIGRELVLKLADQPEIEFIP